jgi:broad specificity phosphatase PhoE
MGYLMFVRHSYREYRNGKSPNGTLQHDSPIMTGYRREIVFKFLYNFDVYGYPDKIICSPFLRNRQTAKIIKHIVSPDVEIFIDKDVEEFLGWQKPKGGIPDLDEETKKYTDCKLGIENFEDIKKRTEKYYEKIKNPDENILIVTHGIFISQLAAYLKCKTDKHIKELSGIVILNNDTFLI